MCIIMSCLTEPSPLLHLVVKLGKIGMTESDFTAGRIVGLDLLLFSKPICFF